MHVTDLALNQTLGIQLAAPDSGHILEMPESPLLLNHLGTIHAGAQFSLAEAASGEFLLQVLGEAEGQIMAVLRSTGAMYRRPARGRLRASARFAEGFKESPLREVKSRGRALANVAVDVTDENGVVTMNGRFCWFLQRQASPTP